MNLYLEPDLLILNVNNPNYARYMPDEWVGTYRPFYYRISKNKFQNGEPQYETFLVGNTYINSRRPEYTFINLYSSLRDIPKFNLFIDYDLFNNRNIYTSVIDNYRKIDYIIPYPEGTFAPWVVAGVDVHNDFNWRYWNKLNYPNPNLKVNLYKLPNVYEEYWSTTNNQPVLTINNFDWKIIQEGRLAAEFSDNDIEQNLPLVPIFPYKGIWGVTYLTSLNYDSHTNHYALKVVYDDNRYEEIVYFGGMNPLGNLFPVAGKENISLHQHNSDLGIEESHYGRLYLYNQEEDKNIFIGYMDNCVQRYYLYWIDRMDGLQCQPFSGKSIQSFNYENDLIESFNNRKNKGITKVKEKYQLKKDWVKAEEKPLYESLLVSPKVWLYDTELDKNIDVIVTSTDFSIKKFSSKAETLTIELERDYTQVILN